MLCSRPEDHATMIGSLRGTLIESFGDNEALIETHGVGYRVTVTPSTAIMLTDTSGEVFLHIFHHIREDTQTLYGFLNRSERESFETLLGAHGVGPTLALGILSVHDPVTLAHAVASDDVDALCLVPGIGKKTATRLLVELKSRLGSLTASGGPSSSDLPSTGGRDSSIGDVRDALIGLGYGNDEIAKALRGVPAGGDPATMLKEALRQLASG